MPKLIFVTSNDHKFMTAQHVCEQFGIQLTRKQLDITEIQADSGETIAKHKAEEAFKLLNQPLVITDDTWLIPGLHNFPGPYMKYMNDWLTPADFLRLTAPLKDRRIILRHIIAYCDDTQLKVFSAGIEGVLLSEIRGDSKYPIFTIVSFDDGKHSAAEADALGYSATAARPNAWHDFSRWLQANAEAGQSK